jgi:feruloyl esterase
MLAVALLLAAGTSANCDAIRTLSTPQTIAATNRNSGLSRPLCAYPQYAKYTGTGDVKDAAKWSCIAP